MPRTGLAVRVIGDDSYWCPREGLSGIAGLDVMAQPAGMHPEPSESLPIVWRRPADELRAFNPGIPQPERQGTS
jgi:hypothetical protein